MFSPWSPGRQSLHIVCVENSNCNYLLRDVCCSQAFVSILFSNILWWSWALSWAYELRESNLPECHWLCRPPPGWIIRWCLITGRDTPPGERNQIYDSGALLRGMWAAVSWSLLTDNIGRGWLKGLAAVARTGPGLFWLTPDATLAGGQYPGHALSLAVADWEEHLASWWSWTLFPSSHHFVRFSSDDLKAFKSIRRWLL